MRGRACLQAVFPTLLSHSFLLVSKEQREKCNSLNLSLTLKGTNEIFRKEKPCEI